MQLPPTRNRIAENTGYAPKIWQQWFEFAGRVLNGREPVRLASYTVARVPPADIGPAIVFITDESGGPVPAFSDGTDWRRITDRQVIS